MIARYNTADYVNTIFRANTPDDLTHTFLYITAQNFKSILRRPHHMITVIENTVLAFVVLHNHTLQKNEPQDPTGRFIFLESMIIHITFALKLARLNICVCGQVNSGFHMVFFPIRTLASTIIFRMIAVIATLNGFPLPTRFW